MRRSRHRCSGMMLLGLLIVLALAGIGLMGMVDNWTVARQREREQQLLFVGDQYRLAIRRYYYAAPAGQTRQLPPNMQVLLEDDRFPIPVRHLRRLYPDPITGNAEFGELRIGDRIAGVYSLSQAHPFKQDDFAPAYQNFAGQEHYQDWVFAFNSTVATLPANTQTAIQPNTSAISPPISRPQRR